MADDLGADLDQLFSEAGRATKVLRPWASVVVFYNQRGTGERWIK